MKKCLIFLFSFFVLYLSCDASVYSPTLLKIENVLYGFGYDSEDDYSRLSRIEFTIYGKAFDKDNVEQRISRLRRDISAEQIGNEISPREDTFADDSDNWVNLEPVADANIQYPAVDELEKIVFNQVFQNKDIKQRLTAIEKKALGQEYNDDLATRVDRLKAELKPQSFMDNLIARSSNEFYYDDVEPITTDYHLERYEPQTFDYDAYNSGKTNGNFLPARKASITAVESSLLRRTYENDTLNNRLARLENEMFGTRFDNDDEQTRMNRISSAYRAQKSASKYDSNKFVQNMSTAMQIGSMLLMILACIL